MDEHYFSKFLDIIIINLSVLYIFIIEKQCSLIKWGLTK